MLYRCLISSSSISHIYCAIWTLSIILYIVILILSTYWIDYNYRVDKSFNSANVSFIIINCRPTTIMTKSFIFIISLDKQPPIYYAGDSIIGAVKLYSQTGIRLRRLYLHFQGYVSIPRRNSPLASTGNQEYFLTQKVTIWDDGKIAIKKLFNHYIIMLPVSKYSASYSIDSFLLHYSLTISMMARLENDFLSLQLCLWLR